MDITQFLPDLGTGFISGAIIGWGIKKAIKIVVALVGIYFLSLLYLAKLGIISINKEAFAALLGNVESSIISYGSQFVGIIHSLSLGTGFVAGFALGFKKG
ncbi:FUN14 domain-containing protein [Methanothermococcus sp.]|uniref:FUN14 domain-containing protein n=1 Tax=Methanothermococcus sp. TaxID=2614238 RepID=UPI0025FC5D88|nr:FUN14 domain-containing protein [Methanothermococcus sp.]